MFKQDEVYVPTEYGTRQCPKHREPCGAFYGIPFSGEIEEQAEYERLQIQASLPDRWFSKRDELVLARLRGEVYELPTPKREQPTKVGLNTEKDVRAAQMVDEFVKNTQAPLDVIAQYRALVKAYVEGEWKLLNDIIAMYQRWMQNKVTSARICGMRI